jgi:hypothetical protein
MKMNQVNQSVELIESPVYLHPDIQLEYEYPEPENHMASGGSSEVLGDFFEFTDYLTPCSRLVMKYRNARQSISEDFYSSLLSF